MIFEYMLNIWALLIALLLLLGAYQLGRYITIKKVAKAINRTPKEVIQQLKV